MAAGLRCDDRPESIRRFHATGFLPAKVWWKVKNAGPVLKQDRRKEWSTGASG